MCTLRGGQQCVVRAKPHSLGLNGEKGKSESEMPRFKYLRNPLKKKKINKAYGHWTEVIS